MTAALERTADPSTLAGTSHQKQPNELEAEFIAWMIAQGYEIAYEVCSFAIAPRKGHKEPQRPTPDLWILALPDGTRLDQGPFKLFLELTNADLYICYELLDPNVAKHNREHARSHRPYIHPQEYINRKRARMAEVERLYPGVAIEVIDHAAQQLCYRVPDYLTELIASRLPAILAPSHS